MFDTVPGQVTDLEPGQCRGRCHRSMAPEANGRQRRPRPGEEPCARLPELVTTEPTVPMPGVRPCFTRLRSRCVYPPPIARPGAGITAPRLTHRSRSQVAATRRARHSMTRERFSRVGDTAPVRRTVPVMMRTGQTGTAPVQGSLWRPRAAATIACSYYEKHGAVDRGLRRAGFAESSRWAPTLPTSRSPADDNMAGSQS